MRQRLLSLLVLAVLIACPGVFASTVVGVITDASTGSPLYGASVVLTDRQAQAVTNFNGQFRLDAEPGSAVMVVTCDGFTPYSTDIDIVGATYNVGQIMLQPVVVNDYYGDLSDLTFDEAALENDEGATQNVAALTGANDNVYYNAASYNFSPMYFRYRGMDNEYQSVYINGVKMNDLVRGSFSFNSLLGMTSRAFRNKTTTVGMDAASYGMGDIAGATNYNTLTDLYAPGFNGSLALTNSNYMGRAMATYSTGLTKSGWALTLSGIARYAKEGVMQGTFYNSGGLFMSLQKKFNAQNSVFLTAFGGPTQRATGRPTVNEAYELAGNNLYNPDWGWQDGKKRSSRITETFDPTVMLNWLFKNSETSVNTAFAFRSNYYNRTAINYYNTADPNPSYYQYLPSYYISRGQLDEAEFLTEMWKNDESFRQINWDNMYQANYLNNVANETLPNDQKLGASYIMENRINHALSGMWNTYVNTRLNDVMSLQGGASANYTRSSNYKTVRDLLGADFWIDIDPFSNREAPVRPGNLQNDLDNPNRRVVKGDRFGYDYDIHAFQADGWLQNVINLAHWDINYGLNLGYTTYYRDGKMRNGRAPQNSLGKSRTLTFNTGGLKAGVLYKLNGHNQIAAHAEYGTRAPLFEQVFISPRVGNAIVDNIKLEEDLSVDLSYIWNYRGFRGSISGFYTQVDNAIERNGFYDDDYQTYANYILTGVKRVYKGIEVGMEYKITPSLKATFAGNIARYQYKSNPQGTRSFENGMYPDTTQTVYLKNYFLGSVPQYNANIGLDYAAPKNWYFGINATWQGGAYVNLAPRYHEAMSTLWQSYGESIEQLQAKLDQLTTQDKIPACFTLNASIGKAVYFRNGMSMNFNLNLKNILNNRNVVTYAYQQGRLRTTGTNAWDNSLYPNRYNYAQGTQAYLNIGFRF